MENSKRPELAPTEIIEELPAACANEAEAVRFFERKRWPNGACCPTCGTVNVYAMTDRKTGERSKRFLWKCREKECGKMFTFRTGTILAESLIPAHQWVRALWECSTAKNGCSALELSRRLQVTYKTALFMLHRLRHAMAPGGPEPKLKGTIEADEMYWGGKARYPRIVRGARRSGPRADKPKTPIFAVIERGGNVRAAILPTVTSQNVREQLLNMADPSCRLVTDEHKAYRRIGRPFARHDTVNHTRKEYVNKEDPSIHTNTIESFWARVRRQLTGTYHNVSKLHLHRYVAHAQWLYNSRKLNDGERTQALIDGMLGKRLMYRDPGAKSAKVA